MKRIFILIAILSLLFPLVSQEISSFRSLSTNGALYDNLDLSQDPIELHYVNGYRLYTNLSNFSSQDQIFKESGSNNFLFGVSGENPFLKRLKFALGIQYYDNRDPLSYDFYPDLSGSVTHTSGEVFNTWQSYQDNNGNFLYDRRHKIYQHLNSFSAPKGNEMILNHSLELSENLILGFKIGHEFASTENSNLSNDMLLFTSMDAGKPTFLYQEEVACLFEDENVPDSLVSSDELSGNFKNNTCTNNWNFNPAVSIITGKTEYRFEAKMDITDVESTVKDRMLYTDLLVPLLKSSENHDTKNNQNSSMMYLGAGVRYLLVPMEERIQEGYLGFRGMIGFGSSDYDRLDSRSWFSSHPVFADSQIVSTMKFEDTTKRNGTSKNLNYSLFSDFKYPLNDITFIGTGFSYWHYSSKSSGDFSNVKNDESYDEAYDPHNSIIWSKSVTNSFTKGKSKDEITSNILSIPVGLEYWFTTNQKWALRFGSVFTQTTYINNSSENPTLSEPETTINTDSDGLNSISVQPNEFASVSTQQYSRDSYTSYNYGLGFKPSDKLQIDLIGYFDQSDVDIINSDFYRNLRLSFSFKF